MAQTSLFKAPRAFLSAFVFLTVLSIVSAAQSKDLINCTIQEGPCTSELGDRTVVLDITPRPVKAMKELTFQVRISGGEPDTTPRIDLGMPGMKMGPNRVEMEKTGGGLYQGKAVIVRCPSGKTVWEALVTIPGTGEASFIFDVIY
jgi:hypothetical protein